MFVSHDFPRKTGSFKMRVCSCNVQSDSQKRLLSAANAAGEYVNFDDGGEEQS